MGAPFACKLTNVEDTVMDMFDFIEANEWAIVASQGLRADWYEITGVHYDGHIYYLDISARRGSEAALSAETKWFDAEMSENCGKSVSCMVGRDIKEK